MMTSNPRQATTNATPLAWLLVLFVAGSGCASTGSNPGPDGQVVGDGYVPRTDGYVPMPDRGPVPKIGSNCQPANTMVLHQNQERTGWLPRIAWSDNQYGVVWAQERADDSGAVTMIKYYPAFVRVNPDGQPAGAAVQLSDLSTARSMEPVGIAGLGQGRFAVLWGDGRQGEAEGMVSKSDLYLRLIDAQGRPQAAEVKVSTSQKASYPYLVRPAFIGLEGALDVRELAVAWRDGRLYEDDPMGGSGRHDVYFKVLELDGRDKVAERRITTDQSGNAPFSPVLASDGNGYALVWRDSAYFTSSELFFVPLGADGAPRTAEQSLAQNKGLLSSSPDLVATGFEYGVGYSENPTADSGVIRLSRIDHNGSVMAVQQVSAAGNPCTPAVAFNGERYALVWQDNCGKTGSKLVFAIVDDGGNALQPDGTSCYGSSDPRCGLLTISPPEEVTDGVAAYPEMISVGGKFAVTWMDAPLERIYFSHIVCQQ